MCACRQAMSHTEMNCFSALIRETLASLVNRGAAVDNQCTIAPVKPCFPRPAPCEFRNLAKFKVHSEVCWQVPLLQLGAGRAVLALLGVGFNAPS